MGLDIPQGLDYSAEEPVAWPIRAARAFEQWARPALGWGVLASTMALTMLPAVALRNSRWLALGPLQAVLEWSGPLAVAVVWALWGWRAVRPRPKWPVALGRSAAVAVLGLAIVSQLLLRWLPGPLRLWQALRAGSLWPVVAEMGETWRSFGVRLLLWWEGVQAGGAAQDNLVFGAIACSVLWALGALTGWLARRTRQGYATAAPSLWLLGTILLYSTVGRSLLLTGLALTILLQLLLDHRVLVERWEALRLDYSPGLLVDRVLSVLSAAVLVLTVAAVMPNLYIRPLVREYYAWIAPLNERAEALTERLFPDLRASSRLRGGGLAGGMPNEFLLQGGPSVSRVEVMRVRTNEAPLSYTAVYEEAPPPARNLRGGTMTVYDGHGWSNPPALERTEVAANERWAGGEPWGRKLVVQSVVLSMNSTILYAAPEPVEVSTQADTVWRTADDLVAVYSRERSYTVVSAVPALDESMLRGLPQWGPEHPVPVDLELHRELPDTITTRTRALLEEIVAGHSTDYERMAAIESYLRQYAYDLEVPPPPDDVPDVADYFLFDLQRGYCDYYATAFVVLARLAGMPARFATGFAAGSWNPVENVWVVTEAEAHSWPEVYFPEIGWVAFEPTAGRPMLARIAGPQFSQPSGAPAIPPPPPVLPEAPARWNWQTLLWLMPAALLVWAGLATWRGWQQRREDPWTALLRWGGHAGRPLAPGETVLEYGRGLAEHIVGRVRQEADAGRVAAREVVALSAEVSAARYGPEGDKVGARERSLLHWAKLRPYLHRLHLGKR